MRRLVAIALVIAFVAAGSSPGWATKLTATRYVEDFTTRLYRDAGATTAEWDTVAGILHLQSLDLRLVGTWDSPGSALGLAVDGDLLFLADGASGLQVVGVTDPAAPSLLGTYNTAGTAYDVDAEGDVVYVADGTSGLRAVNVTNPSAPTALGVYDTPGTAYDVEVQGNLAYVADGAWGLRVVYVANPSSPFSVGTISTGGNANGVDVDGDHAYVAANDQGLMVIDITNPAAPVAAGSYNTAGYASAVAVAGDWAYVADSEGGLVILDVSDPAAPALAAVVDTPDRAIDVAVDGGCVYVAGILGGVHVVDVSDPYAPVLFDSCNPPTSARAVALAGRHAYVADYSSGLRAIEVKEFAEATNLLGALDCDAYGVTVAGDHAFVAAQAGGVMIVDVTDPTAPALVRTVPTPDWAWEVDVEGDIAYVAADGAGLLAIDIEDPASASIIGQRAGIGDATGLDVDGDYAFVCAGLTLKVIDVSNPASPIVAGTYTSAYTVRDVKVAGNHAYVAGLRDGVLILDVTNPGSPSLVASWPSPAYTYDVIPAGDYAYVAASPRVHVLDIRNPALPFQVAALDVSYATDLALAGDELYVVSAYHGIKVLDVSSAAHPLLERTLDTDYAGSVAVVGALVAAGDHTTGLNLFDLFVQTRARSGHARSLTLSDLDSDILQVRALAEIEGDVAFEFSVDGGATWTADPAAGGWFAAPGPGDGLVWHCALLESAWSGDAACSRLELDWVYRFPVIRAVQDVPDDQGGRVRVRFRRAADDFATQTVNPVAGYNVWRRVDDSVTLKALAGGPSPTWAAPAVGSRSPSSPGGAPPFACGDLPLRDLGGRLFATAGAGDKAGGLPPGTWEVVGSFWAAQLDDYVVPAPTLADSAASVPRAVYCVTAHTTNPALWYASSPDSGYSVDNIAPAVPAGLRRIPVDVLAWEESAAEDFQYFSVYGSAVGYLDGSATLIGYTTGTSLGVSGLTHAYFLVTATDCHGNEGGAAVLDALTGVPGASPSSYALHPCAPNPFNPRTTIRFELPEASRVRLGVYDLAGRLVRTLVDRQEIAAGRREAVWDGRDETGRLMAAGTYFCRLEAGRFRETRRMTLVK